MNESLDRLESLFSAALQKPPADRAAYLDRACADDPALRERVEALLRAQAAAGSFLESPAPSPVVTVDEQPVGEGPGTVIGPYKLLQQIGEGGMGTVWMAQQTEPVKRLVAVKLIKAGMDSRQVIARFEAERQALALMDHANIARVLEAGTTGAGRPYFVMDLVKGVPITRYCDEHHLTPRQRLELFIPVCQAVQHAHQKGIIHRDLKPSNVLVALYDGKPVPKVIDFGVAKAAGQSLTEKTLVTGFGTVVGTLEYMSPEQAEINQLDIDTRSDIYSLGVLLYELLTGSPPFTKKDLERAGMLEMLRVIREQEPSRPSTKLSTAEGLPTLAANRGTEPVKLTKLVRGELDWIVMKALEKDRTRRYETANGFAMDLQRYLSDEPVVACPPSARYRFRKFARRNRTILTTVAAVVLSIVGGIVGTTWQAIQATHERDRAVAAEGLAQRRLVSEQKERVRAESAERQAKEQAKRADAEALKARTQAAIAEAVNRFLTDDLLAQANPRNEPDRDIKLRTVLDRAAEKIDGRFNGQPLVEAAIRKTIGQTYLELSLCEAAQRQFERALELRRRNQGEEHRDTISAMNDLAWSHRGQGHYEEAANRFLKTLEMRQRLLGEQHPETLASMDALGQTYRVLRRTEDAERLLQKALETRRRVLGEDHPQTTESMRNLAIHYRENRRNLGEAEQLLLMALAIQERILGQESVAAISTTHNLAVLYQIQGKYAEAGHLAQSALSIHRRVLGEEHIETLRAMTTLGQVYAAEGNDTAAEHWFVKALEGIRRVRGPEHPETRAWTNRLVQVYVEQGKRLSKLGQWDGTIASFQKAIHLMPENAAGHLALGELLRGRRHDYEGSVASYKKAIELDPNNAWAHDGLGITLGAQNKTSEAIAAHRQSVKLDPQNSFFRYRLGLELLHEGKLDEAIAALRESIRLKPDRIFAHDQLGLALAKQGKLDEAITSYHKAIDLDPKYAPPHKHLGLVFQTKGLLEEAAASFREYERLTLPPLREAFRLNPDDADARDALAGELNNLAWLLATLAEPALRDPDRAVSMAREAVELKPQVGGFRNTLGAALYRAGRWKDAIAALEKSMELRKSGDSFDWFFLAMVHSRLGEKDKARELYDRAVHWMDKNQPTNEELRRFQAEASELLELKAKN